MQFGIVKWSTTFTPGNISAIAYDASGAVVARDTVATTGAPASLQVSLVNVGAATYAADGQDVALFTVAILDAKGAVVPNANNVLTFTVTSGPGTIYALGNGELAPSG